MTPSARTLLLLGIMFSAAAVCAAPGAEAGLTTAAAKPKPKPHKCLNVMRTLSRTYPAHAELQTLVGLVADGLRALSTDRYDMAAPANWLTLSYLIEKKLPATLAGASLEARQNWVRRFLRNHGKMGPGSRTQAEVLKIVRLLLHKKAVTDLSCPRVIPVTSLRMLKAILAQTPGAWKALMARNPPPAHHARHLLQANTYSGGPNIYNGALLPQDQNNSAAVGTSYNILLAAPNAYSGSTSGVDQGLLFTSVFSTSMPVTVSNQANSFLCSSAIDSTNSASSTQKQTSAQLGVSGEYEGVTAGANVGFNRSMSQQSHSGSVGTLNACYTSSESFRLGDIGTVGPSALSDNFYSDTMSLIQILVGANWNQGNLTVTARLASWASTYGSHYLGSSYSGGVISQTCFMSEYGYALAQQSGFNWAANLGTAAASASVNASGGSSTTESSQFQSIAAECNYLQSPGSVPVPTSNDIAAVADWLADCIAANILQPSGYALQPIASLFAYTNLWPGVSNAYLSQFGNLVQTYWTSCAAGNSNDWQCGVFSQDCATQTFQSGNECLSCYTSGPECAGLNPDTRSNVAGAQFSSCTAQTCNCNSPYSGGQCQTADLGVCWSQGAGAKKCNVYCNQCAPGFQANWGQPSGTSCACRCAPTSGLASGFTASGVSTYTTSPINWSGSCKDCVSDSLSSIYGSSCGP